MFNNQVKASNLGVKIVMTEDMNFQTFRTATVSANYK